MKKNSIIRIIAIVLVLVLAIVLFAMFFRQKKEVYVDADGYTHYLMLDDEGNTILNDNGNIVAYATDADGDMYKDEEGEYVTVAVDFPKSVIKERSVETPEYKLTMPEGWVATEDGDFQLEDNSDVTVSVHNLGEYEYDINSYFSSKSEYFDTLIDEVKEVYPKTEIKEGSAYITMKGLNCHTVEIRFIDDTGTEKYYTNSVYYKFGDCIYKIDYVWKNGNPDESIDILYLLDENLVMKDAGNT